jgi:hypothetical protein
MPPHRHAKQASDRAQAWLLSLLVLFAGRVEMKPRANRSATAETKLRPLIARILAEGAPAQSGKTTGEPQ